MTFPSLQKEPPHLFESKNFLMATFDTPGRSVIGEEGGYGTCYSFGPFRVEYYTCAKEPRLSPWRGLRLVVWTPVSREDIPTGWLSLPGGNIVYAFVNITSMEETIRSWNKTFRNYAHLWHRQTDYVIEEVSLEEFLGHYSRVSCMFFDSQLVTKKINRNIRHVNVSPNQTFFYGLRECLRRQCVAGISVADFPEVDQSYYVSAFTDKTVAPPGAGLWLCKHWMEQSSARGIRFANLGEMWTKGQPKEWKGFTEFKKKFNPHHIILPRSLVRFTFSLRKK